MFCRAKPSDHLVHRHTHRVVRGTLLVCGRPDGRLSALSTAEASVCLSVNQASSIKSWGGTCESITIRHNPFKLPLSVNGIFLNGKRQLFLYERMLIGSDSDARTEATSMKSAPPRPSPKRKRSMSNFMHVDRVFPDKASAAVSVAPPATRER